ncbi:hypothetical protein JCM16303_000217 [Sporobolomyces ruberrimus]
MNVKYSLSLAYLSPFKLRLSKTKSSDLARPPSGATPFDPLKGYSHKPPTPPHSSEESNTSPKQPRKPSMSDSFPSTSTPPPAASTSPPTSTPFARGGRKVKPQPPKLPELYQTHQDWEASFFPHSPPALPPPRPQLTPSPSKQAQHEIESSNAWHHLPLALVALPPLLSIIHGRAENWSDAILLLLVAFYLYQLVKVPWEMYYTSHTRIVLPSSLTSSSSSTSLPEDPNLVSLRAQSRSTLRRTELVALLSTALVPMLGAYLLHYVRGLLSDPDRYINDTLINLFSIATSVKPFLHFVQLVKKQSLYHQEIVHYPSVETHYLRTRIEKLESDLIQLSRAFATKSDVRALRDGVDIPLSQLSKAVRSFNRKEEYLRLTSSEKFSVLEQKLEEVSEVTEKQGKVLREREREEEEREKEKRMRSGGLGGLGSDGEFVRFLGKFLGHVFALPLYGGGSTSSSVENESKKTIKLGKKGSKGGKGGGKKELGWYERGITWYIFWPVNVPKKAVGWAFELAGKTLKGIEEGYVEEKEAKVGGGGGREGGMNGRSSTTHGTKKRSNNALKA